MPDIASIELAVMQCSSVSSDNALSHAHCLSADEMARNARYRFSHDRHRDLLARSLMRNVLGEYTGVDPREIVFEVGAHGKPSIANSTGLSCHFNLSHAEDWIVLAVSHDPVGVDVEYTPRNNDVIAIADRFFFGDEYRELMSHEDAQRVERFFDYWTLKEAYMKARGEGISLGLNNFGFDLSGGTRLYLTEAIDDDPAQWWFYCDTPVRDYRLALALKSEGRQPIVNVRQYGSATHTTACAWDLSKLLLI